MNFGGWLVTENWMSGIEDSTDAASGRFVLETFRERFGAYDALQLIKIWQDNFITEDDFRQVKAMGFNFIRIPFSYRTLQPESLYQPDSLFPEVKNLDFSRLDWAVQQARKHGLYVVFVYHVWWGQERGRTGDGGASGHRMAKEAYDLITTRNENDRMVHDQRSHAVQLWGGIVRHFKGVGEIAAFQVLNEPYGASRGCKFLIDAVQPLDEARTYLVWGDPNEDTEEWHNIIFGPHLYQFRGPTTVSDVQKMDAEVGKMTSQRSQHNVPYLVGEFHVFNNQKAVSRKSTGELLRKFNGQGISWSMWAWKGVDIWDWTFRIIKKKMIINAATDSKESIQEMWRQLGANEISNPDLEAVYKPEL